MDIDKEMWAEQEPPDLLVTVLPRAQVEARHLKHVLKNVAPGQVPHVELTLSMLGLKAYYCSTNAPQAASFDVFVSQFCNAAVLREHIKKHGLKREEPRQVRFLDGGEEE